MKPSVVVALLVGLIIGFGIGKVVTGPQQGGVEVARGEAAGIATPATEDGLPIKSNQMPPGILDNLSPSQKAAAMKAANEVTCSQCPNDTVAKCLQNHSDCEGGLGQLRRAADLARQGQGSAQIAQAIGGGAAPARPQARPDDSATVFKVPVHGSPTAGRADALITLVEFSDYECPFCSRAHNTVTQLQRDYGNKLRVVMKQNPLSFHANARPAALAALAAGEQGKYWEMHDKLFQNTRALDAASLERYAQDIGLNIAKWKQDMQAAKFAAQIDGDQALASQLGATGTPAFFVNGRKLSGAQPLERFKALIDEELAKAEAMVKSGTKPDQVYAKILEQGVAAPPAAPAPSPAGAPAQAQLAKIDVPADSPFFGPKHAKVTIVEWSDFECPFCARAVPTLKEIKNTYGNDVKVVFRHQPLSFHPNAKPAAEASMAAHEQGKFWEYHDKLFENIKQLDRASLERYAQELGLNMAKFKQAMDSGKYRAKVEADAAAGSAVGANGTPTFFVNGRQLVGAQPFPAFKAIIDEELAKANKLLAEGTKIDQVYEKILATAQAAPAPAPPSAPPPPPVVKDIQLAQAPVKGPKNAPITIVAFSDFECPFCSRVLPTLKQIEDEYKGKVKVAFKHQPLPFHANAKLAAAASMAANEQGKFWEYHDKLFANQKQLDRASLERYAQELGLDMGKFKSVLDSNKYDPLITADSQEGMRIGANGTPTFFINGRQLVGAQPFPSFKAIIDDELAKTGK
jgi:protein-disulfide isomerase